MEKLSAVGSVEEPYTIEPSSLVISTLFMPEVVFAASPTVTAVTVSVLVLVLKVKASLEVAAAPGAIVAFPGFVLVPLPRTVRAA